MNNIAIPTLCHQQNETPVGVCRLCVVDVGARVFTASCVRPAENGMVVQHLVRKSAARSPHAGRNADGRPSFALRPPAAIRRLRARNARQAGKNHAAALLASATPAAAKDDSSMSIAVDFDACILCDRCIRGCSEIRENFVLGRMGKGTHAGIAFDDNEPMGESSLRLLRRVHGLVPHRRAHQQRSPRARRSAAAPNSNRSRPKSSRRYQFSRASAELS